ncbi:MAG: phage virion morphogenesis protein [Pseudomonadota bacterium]
MTARLEIKINTLPLERALAGVDQDMTDLTPLMDAVAADMELATMERFEDGKDPDGKTWKPSIRALWDGGQTLRDTGGLQDSITTHVTATTAEVGTNKIYAGTHQFGATIRGKSGGNLKFKIGKRWVTVPEVTIPARPFLGFGQRDEAQVVATVTDWLERRGHENH